MLNDLYKRNGASLVYCRRIVLNNAAAHNFEGYFLLAVDLGSLKSKNGVMHCAKKATIHKLPTMLSTSKNVLVPGHNHLLTTGTDEPTL